MQLNEMCVQKKITSLVKQHIPDAKLSAESEGKLVYTLPLERTNKFPGNVYEHCEMKYMNNIHNSNKIIIMMVIIITNIDEELTVCPGI